MGENETKKWGGAIGKRKHKVASKGRAFKRCALPSNPLSRLAIIPNKFARIHGFLSERNQESIVSSSITNPPQGISAAAG